MVLIVPLIGFSIVVIRNRVKISEREMMKRVFLLFNIRFGVQLCLCLLTGVLNRQLVLRILMKVPIFYSGRFF